jgi:hypothetical protein
MATSITSLRNPIDDLTSKLNEPPTKPVGSIEEQLAGQRERGARAEELRPQVMKESLGSVETAMQDLQEKRKTGAQDYGKMLEKQAKDTAALEEKYTAMRPEPIEFAPTQQTPEQLQTIAISMMLVGALAGGGAKRSGIAGLKAMTGMLDGYKQGRKDVFDREKIIFEKALETQKQKIEEVKSLYDSALRAQIAGQTAEAKKYEAQLQAELAGGTMLVEVAQGRNNAVMKMLDAASNARDKATESMIAINKAIEDRKMRLEMEKQRMQQQAQLAYDRMAFQRELAQMRLDGKIQSIPGPIEKRLENLGSVKDSLGRISSTEKPEYFGLFPQKEIAETFLTLVDRGLPVGEIASQVAGALGTKLPPVTNDTVNWWKDYREFVAKVRNTLFGQTLTKPEERSFDQFTINPTTSADNAKMYFDRQIAIINNAANRQRKIGESLGINQKTLDAYLGTALGDGTPGNPIKLD